MTATYARENTKQDCANRQRVAFPKGSMFGHLEVVRDQQFREPKILCLCTVSKKTIELSPGRLYIHANGGSKTCPCCNTRQKVWRTNSTRNSGKFCSVCYGYPENRPKIKLCKCGERYSPAFISIDLDNRNPGNLAIVSESRRRTEAPCLPRR